MALAGLLGIDRRDIEASLTFVLDRAAAHDENESDGAALNRLCAATLRRDAAALAILLEDYPKARHFLRLAADQYLQERSFYGLTLLSLTEQSPPWEEFLGQIRRFARENAGLDFAAAVETADTQDPTPLAERVFALQAFSLLGERNAEVEQARGNLSRTFQSFPFPSGSPELRTPVYFRTLDQVASHGESAGKSNAGKDLYALSALRESELRSAQADEYHWPLLLNPADVIGFDILVLAAAAIRHGFPMDPFTQAFGGLDSPVAVPIVAALGLADSFG